MGGERRGRGVPARPWRLRLGPWIPPHQPPPQEDEPPKFRGLSNPEVKEQGRSWEDFFQRHVKGDPRKPKSTSQSLFQVPGTPKPAPHNLSRSRVEIWRESEPCLNPSLPAGSICQLEGPLKKSFKNSGVLGAPPNLRAPGRTSPAPRGALRVKGKWSVFGARQRGLGLKSEAPSAQSPNTSPEQAGGRGTKAGRELAPGGEGSEGSSRLTSWLLGGRAERPRGRCSRGAPGLRFRGSGLAPGSAQSPPGSRPMESGFLGGTWTGPGRVLGRLLSRGL